MRSFLDSVRHKLIWKVFGIFWLTTITVGVANILITKQIVQSESRIEYLNQTLQRLASDGVEVYETQGPRALTSWYKRTFRREELRVMLLDKQDKPLALPPRWRKLERHTADKPIPSAYYTLLQSLEQKPISDSGKRYKLRVLPSAETDALYRLPGPLYLYRLGISFIIILVGSWWLSRSIARPVKVLTRASQSLADGNFNTNVSSKIGSRRDELGELAATFDEMASRIEKLLASQRQLFSNISHDIRTPLTRQKLAIELAREAADPRPMLDKLEQQNQHIEHLIDNLLNFFRLDSQQSLEKKPVQLDGLLKACLENAYIEMEAKSLHLCTHIDSGLTIKGDATLLARAFDNLLANAMKYAPTFSEINMQASRVGPIIRIDIRDQGPGIPETDLKKVIEAFYRSDSSRGAATGGYGLGLAIVDKILKQHNGVLALANAAPTGLIATVSFSVQELV